METEEEVCLACVDAAGEEAGAEHSAADLVGAVHLRRDALLRLQEGDFGGLQYYWLSWRFAQQGLVDKGP